jgi:hypothetical protein
MAERMRCELGRPSRQIDSRLSGGAKLHRELAKSGRKLFARSRNCFWRQSFFFQHRHPREHFVGRDHPIHWNRVAVTSWADQAQRSGAAGTANNQNTAPFNDLTAGKTVTLVVERAPFPVAIESLQNLKFVRAGEFDGSEQWHRDGESQISAPPRNQTNGKRNYR